MPAARKARSHTKGAEMGCQGYATRAGLIPAMQTARAARTAARPTRERSWGLHDTPSPLRLHLMSLPALSPSRSGGKSDIGQQLWREGHVRMKAAPRLIRTLLAASACVCAAGCASMSPSSSVSLTEVDQLFLAAAGSWDLNRDDVVTCQEWSAYAGQLFDGADKGRKGYLTPQEFEKIVAMDRMFKLANFKYFDAGKTGKVTRAGFMDKPNPAFLYADKNHDCQLTTDELQYARALARSDAAPKPMIQPPPSTVQRH